MPWKKTYDNEVYINADVHVHNLKLLHFIKTNALTKTHDNKVCVNADLAKITLKRTR